MPKGINHKRLGDRHKSYQKEWMNEGGLTEIIKESIIPPGCIKWMEMNRLIGAFNNNSTPSTFNRKLEI